MGIVYPNTRTISYDYGAELSNAISRLDAMKDGSTTLKGCDALGDWDSVTTDDGSPQTRSHNKQNEIASVSGMSSPTFDANGNMTGDENGNTLVYDTWSRLVAYKNGGTTLIDSQGYFMRNITLLLLVLVLGCGQSRSKQIVLLTSGSRIDDGLYVVVENRSVDNETEGQTTTIRFNAQHVAYVKNLDLFSPWYQIEFKSSDSQEMLMSANGDTSLDTAKRTFWTLLRDKNHLWIYVGTQSGLDAVKMQKKHKVGEYVLEFPPD